MDSKNQTDNYLFLYLNTGSGHITPATIVKEKLEQTHPGKIKGILVSGFQRRQICANAIFEKSYSFMASFFPSLYSFIFDFTSIPCILALCEFGCTVVTRHYLARIIKKHNIKKIVCFHFAVAPAAHRAIQMTNPNIPLIIDVTDPFTAHPAWWLVPSASFIVHSEEIKQEMIKIHKIKEKNIRVLPFIINEKFNASYSLVEVEQIKANCGINKDQKVILVAGGGEGLPGLIKIVKNFVTTKNNSITLVAVCGRDEITFATISKIAKENPDSNLQVLGYVTNMSDLIKMSDCVVSKAGASMMMQVLACKKPLIISTYIHGQEKGNVDFVIKKQVGWFIRSPQKIIQRAFKVCTDKDYSAKIIKNLDNLNVQSDVTKIVDYVVSKK